MSGSLPSRPSFARPHLDITFDAVKGKPEMNKLTKGAIATAAGVILLMGGAGTLASWNSSSALGGSAISAGTLSVTPTGAGVWKSNGSTITPANTRIVPGDTYTYTQTFTVAATGDNLLFTLAPTAGTFGTTSATADTNLAAQLSRTATFTIVNVTGIAASTTAGTYKVASNTGTASTVTVIMTVAFPYGAVVDNSAQAGSVLLGAGAITLTQTQTP